MQHFRSSRMAIRVTYSHAWNKHDSFCDDYRLGPGAGTGPGRMEHVKVIERLSVSCHLPPGAGLGAKTGLGTSTGLGEGAGGGKVYGAGAVIVPFRKMALIWRC